MSSRPTLDSSLSERRKTLALEHSRLVHQIAKRMASRLPACVDLDDLVQEGALGLLNAIDRFDPERGVDFQIYASRRIRGAIIDSLRRGDWVTRGSRERSKRIHQADELLTHRLGRRPTVNELSEFTCLELKDVLRSKNDISNSYLASLEALREADNGQLEDIVDEDADVEKQVLRHSELQSLQSECSLLNQREKRILSLYYMEGLNMREVGQCLEVSEARISQLHRRCISQLREWLNLVSLKKVS